MLTAAAILLLDPSQLRGVDLHLRNLVVSAHIDRHSRGYFRGSRHGPAPICHHGMHLLCQPLYGLPRYFYDCCSAFNTLFMIVMTWSGSFSVPLYSNRYLLFYTQGVQRRCDRRSDNLPRTCLRSPLRYKGVRRVIVDAGAKGSFTVASRYRLAHA